jgi:hypothetical protein
VKKMRKSVMSGLLLVLVFTLPATAEFYRYQDTHGNTIYTDDYSKVPPEQRQGAQSYDEAISKPETAPKEDQVENQDAQAATDGEDAKELQRLEQRQKALTQEYDALAAERVALDNEKKEVLSSTQIKEYNRKTIEFNARIKAYEEKRDAHTIEVKKFNARMASQAPDAKAQ